MIAQGVALGYHMLPFQGKQHTPENFPDSLLAHVCLVTTHRHIQMDATPEGEAHLLRNSYRIVI